MNFNVVNNRKLRHSWILTHLWWFCDNNIWHFRDWIIEHKTIMWQALISKEIVLNYRNRTLMLILVFIFWHWKWWGQNVLTRLKLLYARKIITSWRYLVEWKEFLYYCFTRQEMYTQPFCLSSMSHVHQLTQNVLPSSYQNGIVFVVTFW